MAALDPIVGNLGPKNAAHLLRRATFGPTRSEIIEFSNYDVNQALNALLLPLTPPNPPIDPLTGNDWLPKPTTGVNSEDSTLFSCYKAWFMELMRTSATNLRERMVYFYHTHLPVDYNIVPDSTAIYYQNALYRFYALGNYKELLTKTCVDNAMLVYIDNTLNDVDSPNENFAREMLELYSIGKGEQIGPEDYTNYTEDDVKQAARVLTGIKHNYNFDSIDPDTGLPRGKVTLDGSNMAIRHDAGTKTFSSKFGGLEISPNPVTGGLTTEQGFFDEISAMMDMIFTQAETANFICRKLYRFFVYYEITPEIETSIIQPLSTTLINNNFDIVHVLRELLMSEHFYEMDATTGTDDNIGALIKSPLEIMVGLLRYFKLDFPSDIETLYKVYDPSLLKDLNDQGMSFYEPIDVAGYPPYHQEPVYNRNWITANWLANRYLCITKLLDGIKDENENIILQLNTPNFVKDNSNISDPSNANTLVSELVNSLFPADIPAERFNYFLNTVFLNNADPAVWTSLWNAYIGGSLTDVKAYLDRLITGLCQSPEFQLF